LARMAWISGVLWKLPTIVPTSDARSKPTLRGKTFPTTTAIWIRKGCWINLRNLSVVLGCVKRLNPVS
jgi:hypothetical protein